MSSLLEPVPLSNIPLRVILPLAWAAVWWGISRAGWIRHRGLRLLVVVLWLLAGGLFTGQDIFSGIPALPVLLLFPMAPFAEMGELYQVARRAGMDAQTANDWSHVRGMLTGGAMAVNCLALHWFLWRRARTAEDGAEAGSGGVQRAMRKDMPEGVPAWKVWSRAGQLVLAVSMGAGAMWGYEMWRGGEGRVAPGPVVAGEVGEVADQKAAGAQAKPVDELAWMHVRDAVGWYGQAMVRGDYEMTVSLMPAKMIILLGGRDKLMEKLRDHAQTLRKDGLTLREVKLGEVSSLVMTDHGLAGLVSVSSVYKRQGADRLVTRTGYVVGLSDDQGRTWQVMGDQVLVRADVEFYLTALTKATQVPVAGMEVPDAQALEVEAGRRKAGDTLMGRASPDERVPSVWDHPSSKSEPTGEPTLEEEIRAQARAGDVVAMVHMAGKLGLAGNDESPDAVARAPKDAMSWLRRAAELGHPHAQWRMAQCLRYGQGVAQASGESVKWYRRAAEQGDAQSQCDLGDWLAHAPDSSAAEKQEGVAMVRKAATGGLPSAQVALARMLWKGDVVARSEARHWEWLGRAADQGHWVAQSLYGIYMSVDGRPSEVMKYLPEAARQGDADAQYVLGLHHLEGKGTKKSRVKACQWWILAAKSNQKQALIGLEQVKESMSPSELAEAERMAQNYVLRETLLPQDEPETVAAKLGPNPPAVWAVGVCLREDGYFLSLQEIPAKARQLFVLNMNGAAPARVVKTDAARGVMLLKAEGAFPAMQVGVAAEEGERVTTSVFRPGKFDGWQQIVLPELLMGRLNAGRVNFSYQYGMAGAPLMGESGNVLGLVLPPKAGKSDVESRSCRVLPASEFPELPKTNGAWHVDRSWETRLTKEQRRVNLAGAVVLVLGW